LHDGLAYLRREGAFGAGITAPAGLAISSLALKRFA
jgi:hypothetical protein